MAVSKHLQLESALWKRIFSLLFIDRWFTIGYTYVKTCAGPDRILCKCYRKKEKKAEIIISANTNNATDQLPSNATSSLQKSAILETTGKTKVPKIGSKTKKNKSYHILKTKCEKHGTLPTHQAEGLVEVGDVFNSLEEFTDYAAGHAQQWFFYYLRFQSRNMKTSSRYNSKKPMFCLYQCRFGKKRYKSQSKGIRKTR